MTTMTFLPVLLLISAIIFSAGTTSAQQGNPHNQHGQATQPARAGGGGCCGQQGQGSAQATGGGQGQRGQGGNMRSDMMLIHSLLDSHNRIRRTVKEIAGGIESLTESDDPSLVPLIQPHVAAMERRLKESRPIHQMDPLFRAIFENASRIEMKIENTAKGVRVTETSGDAKVVDLIRQHAWKVDGFVKEGRAAAMNMKGGGGCMRN